MTDRLLLGAVVANLGLTLSHGGSHFVVGVHVHGWQFAVIGVTVALGPAVGLWLVANDRRTAGVAIVATAGLISLAFEGLFHYVVSSPDHVVGQERIFVTTATVSTLADAGVVVVAVWLAHSSAVWRSSTESRT